MLDPVLPEEQFGYRPRRSTSLAAGSLLQHIRTELVKPRGKLYAVFVDYSKVFNMVNRELTINKLEGLIGRTKLTTLIFNILVDNQIQIDDGIGKSQWLIQTNGVLQGDPLSPILFNALTHDVGAKIKEGTDTVMYMYADDMALVSETIPDLQKAVDLISIWAQTNEIKINEETTELVVFRKGGILAESERIKCNGKHLHRANHFKYLGLTIQTTGKSFRIHLRSRMVAAVRTMKDIKNLKLIALGTARQLFRLKVEPTLTYGLEFIWEYLTCKQLLELEKMKARYTKRVLGVSQHTRSRLVYELAKETFFVEDLKIFLMLPMTTDNKDALRELNDKNDIWEDFYTTEAMTNRK
jgi:hypothetical protein